MPSDPTPTEAEMQEAISYAFKNGIEPASILIAASAYAAALTERRVEREKYVGHCQHCKTTIQNKDGCVVDSRGMFHPICAATLAERERCAKIVETWSRPPGFFPAPIAAAIRGGGQ